MKIVLISATNRLGSMTRRLTSFVEKLIKENLAPSDKLNILDLMELPSEIFGPQSYSEKPASFDRFRKMMVEADAHFLVIPEYNGGPPGVLKHFIDMLPFPESLQRRPTGFVGIAAGRFGALRAVEQTQQIFEYRNAYIYPERIFISGIDKAIDETGKPKDETTLKLLTSEVQGFVRFARKLVSSGAD